MKQTTYSSLWALYIGAFPYYIKSNRFDAAMTTQQAWEKYDLHNNILIFILQFVENKSNTPTCSPLTYKY